MKKTIAILSICSLIWACNSNTESSSSADSAGDQTAMSADTSAMTAEAPTASEGSAKGEELIAKNGCLTCHKVDSKLIGPSYQEVAAKYQATDANIDMLADKIIQGGSGNWGDIPMTPHPTVSKDDAKEMVKYVLAL